MLIFRKLLDFSRTIFLNRLTMLFNQTFLIRPNLIDKHQTIENMKIIMAILISNKCQTV